MKVVKFNVCSRSTVVGKYYSFFSNKLNIQILLCVETINLAALLKFAHFLLLFYISGILVKSTHAI